MVRFGKFFPQLIPHAPYDQLHIVYYNYNYNYNNSITGRW